MYSLYTKACSLEAHFEPLREPLKTVALLMVMWQLI